MRQHPLQQEFAEATGHPTFFPSPPANFPGWSGRYVAWLEDELTRMRTRLELLSPNEDTGMTEV